jgi:hypothetical protein
VSQMSELRLLRGIICLRTWLKALRSLQIGVELVKIGVKRERKGVSVAIVGVITRQMRRDSRVLTPSRRANRPGEKLSSHVMMLVQVCMGLVKPYRKCMGALSRAVDGSGGLAEALALGSRAVGGRLKALDGAFGGGI